MYSCGKSCFISHFSGHSCHVSPADSASLWLTLFANPRQDAAVQDWESDLSCSAKWMTEINIKNQITGFGLKHPFCSFEASDFL